MKKYEFIIENLDCPNCANKIQTYLNKNENLKDVIINFNTSKIIYKTETLTKEKVENLARNIEPEVKFVEEKTKKTPKTIIQVIRLIVRGNYSLYRIFCQISRNYFSNFNYSRLYDFTI